VRTARHRVRLAEKYAALPPEEKAAVDSGKRTVHKASCRVAGRRQEPEAEASPPAAPEQPQQPDLAQCLLDLADHVEAEVGKLAALKPDDWKQHLQRVV
jgi:hypothetical protein